MTASDDLRQRTVSAVAWSLGAQVVLRVLSFAIVVALARLLAPEAFGLVALALVVTGFAAIFTDVGFGAALIQRSEIDERHRSSVLWLSLSIGGALMLLVSGSSPLVAWFFDAPVLAGVLLLVSLDFVLGSVTVVPLALMRREMRFRPLVIIEMIATAAGGGLAILLAWRGAGVWSLVAWTLATSAIRAGLLWWTIDWRPTLVWDRGAIRELFRFSGHLLGFNTVNYWIRNADKLLIGRFLSAWALGIYSRSYALLLLPLGLIGRALGNVMFPAMARIQHDKPRVARLYLRTTRAVSLITFPLMIGLAVTADDFVLALFGPEWIEMTPIVRLFCLAGLLESIGAINGNLYLSQGRSDLQFRVGTIIGVVGVLAVAIGLRWGLLGVAGAYACYSALAFFPGLYVAVRLVDLDVRTVVLGLAGTLACALVMGGLVWALRALVPPRWSPVWRLAIQVAFGMSTYVLLAARTPASRDVVGVLRGHFDLGRSRASSGGARSGPARFPAVSRSDSVSRTT